MARRWGIDKLLSNILGQLMTGVVLPISQHSLTADREWQIWSEIVFVSICHQANWDRLHDQVMAVASDDLSAIAPDALQHMNTQRFRRLFGAGIEDERLDATDRSRILRDLGRSATSWPHGDDLAWLKSRTTCLSGPDGVYDWLERIPAFSEDPLKKKARVLIHQLLRYSLLTVSDPQHIKPAVDYHLIRLYARTNRVYQARSETSGVLESEDTVRVDTLTSLRKAVEEAMAYSAAGACLRVDELNHLEWQIARSFCTRKEARCYSGPTPEKPIDAAVEQLSAASNGGCPLWPICEGARNAKLRTLVDPGSAKSYY